MTANKCKHFYWRIVANYLRGWCHECGLCGNLKKVINDRHG